MIMSTPDVIRPIITGQRPIIVGQQVRDMLGQLHDLYGHDQPLSAILGGLNARLSQVRLLNGPNRLIPDCERSLREARRAAQALRIDSIEDILDLTIDLKKRLNRTAELQGKVMLSTHELREFQVLR